MDALHDTLFGAALLTTHHEPRADSQKIVVSEGINPFKGTHIAIIFQDTSHKPYPPPF